MKTLQQFFATIVLALALVASVHAGDMGCPPADPPPPAKSMASSDTEGPQVQNLTAPDADTDVTIIVRDVIWDLLSMY